MSEEYKPDCRKLFFVILILNFLYSICFPSLSFISQKCDLNFQNIDVLKQALNILDQQLKGFEAAVTQKNGELEKALKSK